MRVILRCANLKTSDWLLKFFQTIRKLKTSLVKGEELYDMCEGREPWSSGYGRRLMF